MLNELIRLTEHHDGTKGWSFLKEPGVLNRKNIPFKNSATDFCLNVIYGETTGTLFSNFYVGCDWLEKNRQAVYVSPKLTSASGYTDFMLMLVQALSHAEGTTYVNKLYQIKMEEPPIQLSQENDLITPLIILHFIQLMKALSRKGLKKGYYRISRDLNNTIKGKVLVSQTIRSNSLKGNVLKTHCVYDEFGLNCLENRILKKALLFCGRYLAGMSELNRHATLRHDLGVVHSAFELVNEATDVQEIKQFHSNPLYKEYEAALAAATLIFKRFGYHLEGVKKAKTVMIPPFWIDMSKLFELYIWGKLKETFGADICFQFDANYGFPDFLLKTPTSSFILDAKYKLCYQQEKTYQIEDIRQLSGYARDKAVMEYFGMPGQVIPCIIIYPGLEGQPVCFTEIGPLDKEPIEKFYGFFKIGISLPVQ